MLLAVSCNISTCLISSYCFQYQSTIKTVSYYILHTSQLFHKPFIFSSITTYNRLIFFFILKRNFNKMLSKHHITVWFRSGLQFLRAEHTNDLWQGFHVIAGLEYWIMPSKQRKKYDSHRPDVDSCKSTSSLREQTFCYSSYKQELNATSHSCIWNAISYCWGKRKVILDLHP